MTLTIKDKFDEFLNGWVDSTLRLHSARNEEEDAVTCFDFLV